MTLILLHDQYGGRGIAAELFRNFAEESLPEDRLPRRPEYHEIEIPASPCDARRKMLGGGPGPRSPGPALGPPGPTVEGLRVKLELMGGNGLSDG